MANVGKVYTRKRFIFTNKSGENKNRFRLKVTQKMIGKILILILIITTILKITYNYVEPIFATMCEDKVKSLATIITNQQSTIVMNKYQYDELYSIERDKSGNILMIKSNIVPMNNLVSDLTENIQHEFDNIGDPEIRISLGSLSGVYFLSGFGPEFPIDVEVTGTVDADIKSEFVSQGINQTLHRVYVDFDCKMKTVTALKNYEQSVVNRVILAEHVIVGNIPDSYWHR